MTHKLLRPFTREDLNKPVRVRLSYGQHAWHEISRVYNIDDAGLVLVATSRGMEWVAQKDVERGRVVETWKPEL